MRISSAADSTAPSSSAAATDHQTPSTPKSSGITSTSPPRSSSVRVKAIRAESAPLQRAVKKAEA